MPRIPAALAVFLSLAPAEARPPARKPARAASGHAALGTITLDRLPTHVRWTDGDSFKVLDGPHRGRSTRLSGYNTLEAFGPVHSWGEWTPEELLELALTASSVAASQPWECATDGKEDSYHRLLVSCPALSVEMARQGRALAYAVDGQPADAAVLEAQREAQTAGRGIWRRGVVRGVVTSVHSAAERGLGADGTAYNRVVDTRTGQAMPRPHRETYRTCQRVCEETEGERSCMVYVPFEHRYREKPACLKVKGD
jgi:micrococcal nuclease